LLLQAQNFNKILIKIVECWLFLTNTLNCFAQQEFSNIQYLLNPTFINPSFAGNNTDLQVNSFYKQQWVNLASAPKIAAFSADLPVKKHWGTGILFQYDKIGYQNSSKIVGQIAYKVKLNSLYNLDFGMQFGTQQLQINLADLDYKLPNNQQIDPVLTAQINQWKPVVGFGLHFHQAKYFVSISSPNLLATEIQNVENNLQSKYFQQYYFCAGLNLKASKSITLKPAILLKNISGTPLLADFNTRISYQEKFTLGLSYASNQSANAFFQFTINKQFTIGYAYKYYFSTLKYYQAGSQEIALKYILPLKKKSEEELEKSKEVISQ